MAEIYFDTSALAKWYVNEAGSEEVEAYLMQVCPVCISLLTLVEMKSLISRRGRQGDLDAVTQAKVLAAFDGDVAHGHLTLLPQTVDSFQVAEWLLGAYPDIPLLTLDALHLGVMRSAGVSTLATADRVMAQAAEAMGMGCQSFW